MSYSDIGYLMGFSGEYIRRIEQQAIRKIKQHPEARIIFEEYITMERRVTIWETLEQNAWSPQEKEEQDGED